MKMSVYKFVRQFDEDYDNFLRVDEFCLLLKELSRQYSMLETQRLAHIFSSLNNNSRINVMKLVDIKLNNSNGNGNREGKNEGNSSSLMALGDSVNVEAFKSI